MKILVVIINICSRKLYGKISGLGYIVFKLEITCVFQLSIHNSLFARIHFHVMSSTRTFSTDGGRR